MSRRYYRKHYRRYNNYREEESPLELLLELLFGAVVWLLRLIADLVYELIIFAIAKIHNTTFIRKRLVPMESAELDTPSASEEVRAPAQQIQKGALPAPSGEVYLPYKKKGSMLTETEIKFNDILKEVVDGVYHIERQVVIASLVDTTTSYKPYRSKIDKKTVDFVLTDNNYIPQIVIELDDPSHYRWDRIKRDAFVENVFKKVGIRIVRIKAAPEYNRDELKKLLLPLKL